MPPTASARRSYQAACGRCWGTMARRWRCRSVKVMSRHPSARSPAAEETSLWSDLRRLTAARIGLRRTGASLATAPLLDFRLAHARARDAVHAPLDEVKLRAELARLGVPVIVVVSAASDRQQHLMRPDLGRTLAPDDAA